MRYTQGVACSALLAAAMLWSAPVLAQDGEEEAAAVPERGIDVITVTAQKKSESLLDVPIAVTAFDSEGLDRMQIDNFSDLQFNTPNVSFTKTNFTGSNFQVRGIGSTLVATSADTGVGIHVNDVYLNSARIFELEYFDVERVEVLRGPQGTLYGRNATGGSVNMVTRRPVMDDYEVNGEVEVGNYDHMKFKGAVNIPIIEDKVAVRLAGIYLKRDGYTENIYTGNDLDGRDNFAVRGSVRIQPTDTTTIDFMVSHFNEDSNRLRSQKQMCNRDESAVLGCLPDTLEFENVNGNATLGGLLTTELVLSPLNPAFTGANDLSLQHMYGQAGGFAGVVNPADMRQVNLDFEPTYHADETFMMAQIDQALFDRKINLTLLTGWQETSVFSQQDYNMTISDPINVPAGLIVDAPFTWFTYYSSGQFPISSITPGDTGLIGGNILKYSNLSESYDQSSGKASQVSFEGRISSDFEGPFNFLLAGYWLNFDASTDYYVVATALDYFSVVGGATLLPVATDGVGLAPPFYNNKTDQYSLDSWAVFGEGYYDITPDLKLTGGLRYSVDQKFIRDRVTILNVPAAFLPFPTTDVDPNLVFFGYDADGGTPGNQLYREGTVEFSELTGRAVLDWSPDLSFTDASLFYASYSRGYKAGGLNPPFDPVLFPNTPVAFQPEFINAYEIGMKHTLLHNTLQANLSAFYYDYGGLQVSKIQNRTSVNENIDATVWGLEGEFLYAPDDNWLFNTNVSYLNTEIGDAFSVDPRDPTAGRADVLLLKDFQAANCVVVSTGGAAPTPLSLILDGGFYLPPPDPGAGYAPDATPSTDGINSPTGFTNSCAAVSALYNPPVPGGIDPDTDYALVDGIPVSLKGNQLQNSPEWTASAGVQYTFRFANGMTIVPRFDYYWQGAMYARIFNRPIDKIDSWDVMNAQVTLNGIDQRWYLRFFIQNIEDDDNVTGQYLTDASSGLFTNVFTLEPRLYGVAAGVRF